MGVDKCFCDHDSQCSGFFLTAGITCNRPLVLCKTVMVFIFTELQLTWLQVSKAVELYTSKFWPWPQCHLVTLHCFETCYL